MKRITKILLTFSAVLLMFLLVTTAASAAPALERDQTLSQPSGETFTAVQIGDEHFNYTVTDIGAVVTQAPDGYWYYTIPDEAGGTSASSSKYIIDTRPDNALTKEDMPKIREEQTGSQQADSPAMKASAIPNMSAPISQAAGTQHILVLLVSFSDVPIQYTESAWSNEFFGMSGKTVRTYYQEVSGNKLDFAPAFESYGTAGDGVVSVTLPYTHPNTYDSFNLRNQQIVKDALIAADSYVDFASYDLNGDRIISMSELHIVTVVAGYERSYSLAAPSVWAHHGTLDGAVPSPVLDGVSLCSGAYQGGYVQAGEKHGDHMATIGVFCHELGHDLGLPDLYDTVDANGKSEGVGKYSLMGSGNWGYCYGTPEMPGTTPTHLDAWSKIELGFATPTVITDPGSYTARSIDGGYNVMRMNTQNPAEYFLLEYRRDYGFDKGLNLLMGCWGIAIWHIDESVIEANYASNTVNGDENHKGVGLEESNYASYGGSQLNDNNSKVLMYDCLYKMGQGFSPDTSPNSRLYSGADTDIRLAIAYPYMGEQYKLIINVGPITSIGAIAGTPIVGNYLTSGDVSLINAAVLYQWQRADASIGPYTNIEGALGSNYQLTAADRGKYIRVTITGTDPYIGTVSSAAVGPVKTQLMGLDPISGIMEVGNILMAGDVTPASATITYQWMRAPVNGIFTNIPGATNRTYILTSDDYGMYIRVKVTGTGNYTGELYTDIGPLVSYQLASIDAITGMPVTGSYLQHGSAKTLDGKNTSFVSYQWMRADSENGEYTDIPGESNSKYWLKNTDSGKYFEVKATGFGVYTGTVTSAAVGPILIEVTSITGVWVYDSIHVGTICAVAGITPTEATVTYQWYRGISREGTYNAITGANESTYVITGDDIGNYIKVRATGNGAYGGYCESAPIGPLVDPDKSLTGIGAVTGTAQVGMILSAGEVIPAGATATYQWQHADYLTGTYTNISGATGQQYVPTSADLGKYLRVTATGTGQYTGTVTSSAAGPVTTSVTTEISYFGNITGNFAIGSTLTAGPVLPAGATVTYQWQRADYLTGTYSSISDATGQQYVPTSADFGKYLRVTATGTGLYIGTVTSSAAGPVTAMVNTEISFIGNITGRIIVSSTLTAGPVLPAGATVTYQWQRADYFYGTYSNIEGATGSTYILGRSDLRKSLRVIATGTGAYTGSVISYPTEWIFPALFNTGSGLAYNSAIGTASVTVQATNGTDSDMTVDFVIAAYSSAGKLLNAQIISGVSLAAYKDYSHTVTLICGSLPDAVTVKIFALDRNSGFTPITYLWSGTA